MRNIPIKADQRGGPILFFSRIRHTLNQRDIRIVVRKPRGENEDHHSGPMQDSSLPFVSFRTLIFSDRWGFGLDHDRHDVRSESLMDHAHNSEPLAFGARQAYCCPNNLTSSKSFMSSNDPIPILPLPNVLSVALIRGVARSSK